MDSLKACDKICFTVYGNETVKEKEWAPYMQSVVIFGRCHLIENDETAMELFVCPDRASEYAETAITGSSRSSKARPRSERSEELAAKSASASMDRRCTKRLDSKRRSWSGRSQSCFSSGTPTDIKL